VYGVVDHRAGDGRQRNVLDDESSSFSSSFDGDEDPIIMRQNIKYFIFLLALIVTLAVTLAAYISDNVEQCKDWITKYG